MKTHKSWRTQRTGVDLVTSNWHKRNVPIDGHYHVMVDYVTRDQVDQVEQHVI